MTISLPILVGSLVESDFGAALIKDLWILMKKSREKEGEDV
jgi:hypothetical protein